MSKRVIFRVGPYNRRSQRALEKVGAVYLGLQPSLTDIQIWSRNGTGTDLSEPGGEFGRALSAWNFGNSSLGDLPIGAPFEDVPAGGTGPLQIDAVPR